MSVIFKERHYDWFIILIKKTSLFLLILVVILLILNFSFNNKNQALNHKLKLLQEEEQKHLSLLTETEKKEKSKTGKAKKLSLLIVLADYAENLHYNSFHFRNDKIVLEAVSSSQEQIFKLIDSLKTDELFSEVNLINISQRNAYYFQLEATIPQQ